MAASYPGSLKSFTTKTDKEDLVSASHVNDLQDEVVAVQTELGTDVAGSLTDLKTRLAVMIADDGALRQGTSYPGSPSEGDMFYRTDLDTVYIYDGSGWDAVSLSSVQVFTANGTFTPPSGVTKVWVSMIGGGGGGGTCQASSAAGGGGGSAGEYCIHTYFDVSGGAKTVTIGAGGAGGTAPNDAGSNGGATSFDTLSVAGGNGGGVSSGGTGGTGGASPGSANYDGAEGGAAAGGAGGDYGIGGGAGGDGYDSTSGGGGGGGGSPFGPGAAGGAANTVGSAADDGTGGGGGAGGAWSSSGEDGGDGGDGVCIVIYHI